MKLPWLQSTALVIVPFQHPVFSPSKGILEKTNIFPVTGNTSYSWKYFIFCSFTVLPVLVVH